ncbi:glycosyltransferase [Saccharomonospora sp.]|uniref:glycosyltransferase n=1 Tax=Saccharomonospora sp. TaxID=33913 RepID=UPI0026216E07|nr:glycosyltransferase [Saccharomonospora sp.]
MKALLYAYGSRGDVQPYLALAHAMVKAGHEVMLAGPESFAPLAARYGIEYFPRSEELLDFYYNDPDVADWLRNQGHDYRATAKIRNRALTKLGEYMAPRFPEMLKELSDAADQFGPDMIIQSYEMWPWEEAHHVAEKLDVPYAVATLFPNVVPNWTYPVKFVPPHWRLPGVVSRLTYELPRLVRPVGYRDIADWRHRVLGLPERKGVHPLRTVDGKPVPVVHGFSSRLVPEAKGWPPNSRTTGFWFLPTPPSFEPDPELVRFLDSGSKPVCVTFGTVRGTDPRRAGELVVEAVRRAGTRAVVIKSRGSIEIPAPPADVFVTDDVPYPWLLPRVAAVVHAAGVGTVNEALRAGVPQVACPVHNEQASWAMRAHAIGVAPRPIRNRDLESDNLAQAIRTATNDPEIARRAEEHGAAVRQETGAATAAMVLEQVYKQQVTAGVSGAR